MVSVQHMNSTRSLYRRVVCNVAISCEANAPVSGMARQWPYIDLTAILYLTNFFNSILSWIHRCKWSWVLKQWDHSVYVVVKLLLWQGHCWGMHQFVSTVSNLKTKIVIKPRSGKPDFCIYAKIKAQISFSVTAQLINAFCFLATWIVKYIFLLNPKFQVSSHLQWLYSSVCARPGRKPRKPIFSERGSYCLVFLHHFSMQSLLHVVLKD